MRREELISRMVVTSTLFVAIAAVSAPPAVADSDSTLTQALVTARSSSSCTALQPEPLVQRVAQMASKSTSDYINFRSAAVPFTDPLPVLATVGYSASKGMLLSGYGESEGAALEGLMLQWQASKPDCSYTQFGVNTMRDDAGFTVASAIFATPGTPTK